MLAKLPLAFWATMDPRAGYPLPEYVAINPGKVEVVEPWDYNLTMEAVKADEAKTPGTAVTMDSGRRFHVALPIAEALERLSGGLENDEMRRRLEASYAVGSDW